MFLSFNFGVGPFPIEITDNKIDITVEEFEVDIEVVVE